MKSRLITLGAAVILGWPLYSTANVDEQLLHAFPADISLQRLWDSMRFDQKESRTYRFNSNQPLNEVRQKLVEWMAHPSLAPQAVEKNGWTYLSHQKAGWWVTAQIRPTEKTGSIATSQPISVEGLVTFWRSAQRSSEALRLLPVEQLMSLRNAKMIRRIEATDNGKLGVTTTLVSQSSIYETARNLDADLRGLGLRPAPYAPPGLQSVTSKNETQNEAPVSQAWLGVNSQLVLTIFKHRGSTAILIHWTTGRQDEK
jgi:hypothetical protein